MFRKNSKPDPCHSFVPLFVTTASCPPLAVPYSGAAFPVTTFSSAIESNTGTIATPMFTSSCASAPFTRKLFAVSRCPPIESVPASNSPDGGVLATPLITIAFACDELAGVTPGSTASASVKLRPFSGTDCICFASSVPPVDVSLVASAALVALTATVSLVCPTFSASVTVTACVPTVTVCSAGANPCALAATTYSPIARPANRNAPSASATVSASRALPAGLAVTRAPGITAPETSVTTPQSAVVCCAVAAKASSTKPSATTNHVPQRTLLFPVLTDHLLNMRLGWSDLIPNKTLPL